MTLGESPQKVQKEWLMSDKKIEQRSTDVPTTKPSQPGGRPVAGWKRWHLKSRVILMLLGAIAVIVYLCQAGLAKQYEGLGAALCAVACGGFLVWHAVHVFVEEDAVEEQQINRATDSSPQLNPADKETNI